ncbi:AAA family ATPase [Salmonella enterica]|nr:AAA family ATPase [Salmonella enterica]
MTQFNHDALRAAVRERMEKIQVSGAALAREMGVSKAVVSGYLNDKYRGDNEAVAASLNTWLESSLAAAALPESPAYIETPTAERIAAVLTYAQVTGRICLVYGHSGVGKTEAIKEFARTGNNVWFITASKSRSNELEAMYEIALAAGIKDAPYRRGALSRELRRNLINTGGLIIVDEADWLSYEAIEELRILQEECGIGLVMAGNHQVYDRLTGGRRAVDFARLFSRVAKRIVINNVDDADITAFCAAWRITGRDELAMLHAIAKRPGGLRSIAYILPLAAIYANAEETAINIGHIHTAMLEQGHDPLPEAS